LKSLATRVQNISTDQTLTSTFTRHDVIERVITLLDLVANPASCASVRERQQSFDLGIALHTHLIQHLKEKAFISKVTLRAALNIQLLFRAHIRTLKHHFIQQNQLDIITIWSRRQTNLQKALYASTEPCQPNRALSSP